MATFGTSALYGTGLIYGVSKANVPPATAQVVAKPSSGQAAKD